MKIDKEKLRQKIIKDILNKYEDPRLLEKRVYRLYRWEMIKRIFYVRCYF